MHLIWLFQVVVGLCATLSYAATTTPSRTVRKRDASPFVTTANGKFQANGSAIRFIGTNAYWLSTLNTDADINKTLASIAATGSKVVRVWAFNDVTTIPVNGTWFQLILSNGTTVVNTGPNGLQKLDTVVELAQQHGLFVLLSLTNNWNPLPLVDNTTQSTTSPARRDVTQGTNNTLPRNSLSNDYGGMDVYVRQLGVNLTHDQFYTNDTLINAFENYIKQIVTRYINSTSVFSWELANDPRCGSSIVSSPSCTTTTITQWHDRVSTFIQSVDPNHLISAGTNGFFCADCPKLFPPPAAPAAQPSPAANSRRRRRDVAPVSKAKLLLEQTQLRKKNREAKKRAGGLTQNGIKIRGRWIATPERRQDTGVGPAFDGTSGVDSEDISGIPQIGFLSFQLFPDQNTYGPSDPNLSPVDNTIQTGITWIQQHIQTAQLFNKPSLLSTFGVVTQNNSAFFVPFNSTIAPFANSTTGTTTSALTTRDVAFGVTDDQRNEIYTQWISVAADAGISGMLQYQWGEEGLTSSPGTPIQPAAPSGNGVSPIVQGTGVSPNDGYGIASTSDDGIQQVVTTGSASFS